MARRSLIKIRTTPFITALTNFLRQKGVWNVPKLLKKLSQSWKKRSQNYFLCVYAFHCSPFLCQGFFLFFNKTEWERPVCKNVEALIVPVQWNLWKFEWTKTFSFLRKSMKVSSHHLKENILVAKLSLYLLKLSPQGMDGLNLFDISWKIIQVPT